MKRPLVEVAKIIISSQTKQNYPLKKKVNHLHRTYQGTRRIFIFRKINTKVMLIFKAMFEYFSAICKQ